MRSRVWVTASLGLFTLVLLASTQDAERKASFVDVTKQAGIAGVTIDGSPEKKSVLDVNGSGVCWLDYNNDGWEDLFVVNGSTVEDLKSGKPRRQRNYLYRNDGNGKFTDVTAKTGVGGLGWGQGCAAADINNDGFTDLLVTNFGRNELFKNNGDGTFTEVALKEGVGGGNAWHTGAAFADYDNDGWVDLFVAGYLEFDVDAAKNYQPVCNYRSMPTFCGPRGFRGGPHALYHNNHDGTFTEVTEKAGVANKESYYGLGVLFQDLDGDGRPDILVANDACFNYFYHNEGNGKFKEDALSKGIACCRDGTEQANMGLAVGDYDNDGKLDVFITTYSDDHYTLYKNQGSMFNDVTRETGLYYLTHPFMGWGTMFVDFNNDGFRDLFAANGHLFPQVDGYFKDATSYRQRLLLLQNEQGQKFRDVGDETGLSGLERHVARGAAAADFDNDGRVDIAVSNLDEVPSLIRNAGSAEGHWLRIRTVGKRSNRGGIGARIEVTVGDLKQVDWVHTGGSFLSQHDVRVRFGLGANKKVDVKVYWPSGVVDSLRDIAADRDIVVEEGSGLVDRSHH
jgi:enediyne biosynthesis protein E4